MGGPQSGGGGHFFWGVLSFCIPRIFSSRSPTNAWGGRGGHGEGQGTPTPPPSKPPPRDPGVTSPLNRHWGVWEPPPALYGPCEVGAPPSPPPKGPCGVGASPNTPQKGPRSTTCPPPRTPPAVRVPPSHLRGLVTVNKDFLEGGKAGSEGPQFRPHPPI